MYTVLLLNGGIGSRIGADQPKQFLKIGGLPILVYPLAVIDRISEITQIILNFPPGQQDIVQQIVRDYAIKTPVTFVEAGETRHESVAKMLTLAEHERVFIHEAARPMVEKADFESLVRSGHRNVSLMSPISFTVAPVDPSTQRVTGSLDRSALRNVQLPQLFNRSDLATAHTIAQEKGDVFTEDATLLAEQGFLVHFIEGNDRNIKVTTPVDLNIAHYLLHQEAGEEHV